MANVLYGAQFPPVDCIHNCEKEHAWAYTVDGIKCCPICGRIVADTPKQELQKEPSIVTKAKEALKDFDVTPFTEENHPILNPDLVRGIEDYLEQNRICSSNKGTVGIPMRVQRHKLAIGILKIIAEYQWRTR